MKFKFLSFGLLSTLSLVGCTDYASTPPSSTPPSSAKDVKTVDSVVAVIPNKLSSVNLTSYLRGDIDGVSIKVVPQASLNTGSCDIQPLEGASFTAYVEGTCVVNYQVLDNESVTQTVLATGRTQLVASQTGYVTLPPLTQTATVGTPFTVDLKTALPPGVIDTYTLNDTYELFGDGVVTIDATQKTITYEPSFSGKHRIIYSATADDGSGDSKVGTIDIVANEVGIKPPFVAQKLATYPTVIDAGVVTDNDITPFVDVTAGAEFKLIDLVVFNANATMKDPEDVLDKTFVFDSDQLGPNYVTYQISDGNGAFDLGILKIMVSNGGEYPYIRPAVWDDIVLGTGLTAKVFSGTASSIDALNRKVETAGDILSNEYSPSISVALFNKQNAEAYCASLGGTLPLANELSELFTQENPGVNHDWPVKNAWYITADDQRVDLETGTVINDLNHVAFYVTCLLPLDYQIELTTTQREVFANGQDEAEVIVSLRHRANGIVGAPLSGLLISATVSGSARLKNNSISTDSDGVAIFHLTDTSAGIVTLTLGSPYGLGRAELEFVGDVNTARLGSIIVSTNNALADLLDENVVTVTLVDANNNPIKNQSVNFSEVGGANKIGWEQKTDENGVISQRYIAAQDGVSTITASFGTSSLPIDISFTPFFRMILCNDAVNNTTVPDNIRSDCVFAMHTNNDEVIFMPASEAVLNRASPLFFTDDMGLAGVTTQFVGQDNLGQAPLSVAWCDLLQDFNPLRVKGVKVSAIDNLVEMNNFPLSVPASVWDNNYQAFQDGTPIGTNLEFGIRSQVNDNGKVTYVRDYNKAIGAFNSVTESVTSSYLLPICKGDLSVAKKVASVPNSGLPSVSRTLVPHGSVASVSYGVIQPSGMTNFDFTYGLSTIDGSYAVLEPNLPEVTLNIDTLSYNIDHYLLDFDVRVNRTGLHEVRPWFGFRSVVDTQIPSVEVAAHATTHIDLRTYDRNVVLYEATVLAFMEDQLINGSNRNARVRFSNGGQTVRLPDLPRERIGWSFEIYQNSSGAGITVLADGGATTVWSGTDLARQSIRWIWNGKYWVRWDGNNYIRWVSANGSWVIDNGIY